MAYNVSEKKKLSYAHLNLDFFWHILCEVF